MSPPSSLSNPENQKSTIPLTQTKSLSLEEMVYALTKEISLLRQDMTNCIDKIDKIEVRVGQLELRVGQLEK